jgi:L-iditol 2-dehydrogenase
MTTSLKRGTRVPAALQTDLRRIEVGDVPMPWPKAGEVLVELSAVGICGSDLHYFRHGRIGAQVLKFPQILGHEPAGVVAAIGKGVRGFKEGQTVAVEPGISCGRCRPCKQGRANLCYHVRFLGGPGMAGAFQRYLAMPVACIKSAPKGVDAALASAAEPLGIAVHAMHLTKLRRGEAVAVIGGGPIGLSVVAMARAAGAKVVALSERREARRKAALELGAARVVDPESFVQETHHATNGLGATVVFECSGAPEAVDAAVAASERGGRIALVGITETDDVKLDPHEWREREMDIVQVRRSNHTLPHVLAHLRKTDFGLRRAGFFSETVGLEGVQRAFEQLDDNASPAIKIIVDPRL